MNQITQIGCLRGMDTLSMAATLLKSFWLSSINGSTLKGKNLLPLGANSFLLEETHFLKELDVQGSKE